jgi:hypothetical protein
MKTQFYFLICFCITLLPLSINAQRFSEVKETFETMRTDSTDTFNCGISLGLDFSTLSMINPRPNEGQNALGFGGLLSCFTNYTGKKTIFDSRVNIQLSALRAGDKTQPFAKTSDVFQLNMVYGRQIKGKMYLAAMTDLRTQLLDTYGNGYINDHKGEFSLTSEAFSPATLKLVPGLLYRPNPDVKFLFSVISTKMVIVSNNALAAQGDSTEGVGLLGNPYNGNGDFQNVNRQWGAELRGEITKKLCNDRLIISSVVDLYSNYLRNPENIAFEWYNSVDVVLFKNLSLNLKSDWFYDHNILVHVGGDPTRLGRRMFIRNAAFVKFNLMF